MALLFMDGFDHYDTTALQVPLKWDAINIGYGSNTMLDGSGGRFGAGLRLLPDGTEYRSGAVRKTGLTGSSGCVGFAYKQSSGASGTDANYGPLRIMEGSTVHLNVACSGASPTVLSVYRAGTLLGAGTISFPENVWVYVEFSYTIDDSSGSYELKINGNTSISGSSVDTRNGGTGVHDTVELKAPWCGGNYVYYDDVYIKSDTTFLGDVRVETVFPTGNGNSSSWVGSDGNSTDNYALVDESPANGDTDYVKSSTVNAVDSYALGDLTTTAGTVYGVQYLAYSRKDDAGSRTVAPLVRIGSTDYPGTGVSLGNSYVYLREMKSTSPATATAWTISEINAMEYGAKVTA